jgi:hypothetical protein
MTTLLALFVVSGLLLAGLSVPLMLGKIGPNPWYGFRVRRTLADPAVWYAANTYSAKWFFAVGLLTSMVAVLLYCLPGVDTAEYAIGTAGVVLVGLAVTVIQSFRYLGNFE